MSAVGDSGLEPVGWGRDYVGGRGLGAGVCFKFPILLWIATRWFHVAGSMRRFHVAGSTPLVPPRWFRGH